MNPIFIQISAGILLILVSVAGTYLVSKRKFSPSTRSQPEKDDLKKEIAKHVPDFSDVLDQIEELEKKTYDLTKQVDSFNLKATELEEFITRNMNKMSARYGRIKKMEDEEELRETLLKQAQELNGNHKQPDIFDVQSTNYRPRLRRNE